MATKSGGKSLVCTSHISKGNIKAQHQPTAATAPLIGGAGVAVVDATSTDGQEESEPCEDGHPVDVFGGDVVDSMVDLTLNSALIPVELKRLYNSVFAPERTVLGVGGWTFSLSQWIEAGEQGLRLRNEDGRYLRFDAEELGRCGSTFKRSKRLELTRLSYGGYRVYSLDTRLTREYTPTPGLAAGDARAWHAAHH